MAKFSFSAVDSLFSDSLLMLKALALVLTPLVTAQVPASCYHLAGRGGIKAAINEVADALKPNAFVMKSDIKGYYAHIDHSVLLEQLQSLIDDPTILNLIKQYLGRCVQFGGLYQDVTMGISLGCPLSPLMGALYLKPLDELAAASGCFYARYMDDWVIIAPTRRRLRRVVKQVNQLLNQLRVEKHPGKTFIGRTDQGFDFLGARLCPEQPRRVAKPSIQKLLENITRLYEQGASDQRIGDYFKHWMVAVCAMLGLERSRVAFGEIGRRNLL